VKLLDYNISDLDTLLPTLEYTLTYEVPDYTVEAAELLIVRLPWYAPYEPASALSYNTRTYPYEFANYIDTLTETMTLSLPAGYQPLGAKEVELYDSPISRVERRLKQQSDELVISRKAIYRRNVVGTDEYQAYKSFHNNVSRSDRQSLLLVPKGTVIKAPKRSRPSVQTGP
jgi:hypothetical protein